MVLLVIVIVAVRLSLLVRFVPMPSATEFGAGSELGKDGAGGGFLVSEQSGGCKNGTLNNCFIFIRIMAFLWCILCISQKPFFFKFS
jgi:hypothetical protein